MPCREPRNSVGPSVAARWWRVGLWLAFAACLGGEFVFFDQVGAKHHTWIYPRWNDQIQYLTECYTGFEFARLHGFWRGLWATLINPSAQGTLHDFYALIAFTLAGGA